VTSKGRCRGAQGADVEPCVVKGSRGGSPRLQGDTGGTPNGVQGVRNDVSRLVRQGDGGSRLTEHLCLCDVITWLTLVCPCVSP